jgi:hypothetical protein
MAKKEKSAIEAILELKNKKNKKIEEKVAKLKAEKAKVEARIKKAEAEERAKTEKGIEAIYSKISKEIKNKSGIIPFLRKEAPFLTENELSIFFGKLTEVVKKEVDEMSQKVRNFELESDKQEEIKNNIEGENSNDGTNTENN